MSEPPTSPPNTPQAGLKIGLLALAVVALLVIALSFGGLVFWLVTKRSAPATENRPAQIATHGSSAGPLPAGATDTNVIELFNGNDLEGWAFDPTVWSVRNGVIYGRQKNGGNLFWRGGEVDDFELRFRFRLVRGNSGVYYRARQLANFDVGGYEFEIYTNKTGNLADNGSDRTRRRFYQAEPTNAATDSEWHEAVVTANGPRLIHVLDGKTLCDVEDTDPAAPRKGFIALGAAGGTTVEFKDIRLKRMKGNQ